jgi:riboflavin-specific deaminase-like protein
MNDLERIYEWIPIHTQDRIFVTLTFAQTLDGFIGRKEEQLLISAKESLVLTHALRTTREAILIGIGTVLIDRPSLTTRMVQRGPGGTPIQHPIPVIVDSKLQIPLDCSFMDRHPIIFCSAEAPSSKRAQLDERGCRVIPLPLWNGKLDLKVALDRLDQLGIKSLMVEGSSRIIQEFLSRRLMDEIIVTIAPRFLGEGIHATLNALASTTFSRSEWRIFGPDIVLKASMDDLSK